MRDTTNLQQLIETAFDNRADLSPKTFSDELRAGVNDVLAKLDDGSLRVAEKQGDEWVVHQWVKKAVLLSFRMNDNRIMQGGRDLQFFDKVDTKFEGWGDEQFAQAGAVSYTHLRAHET